MRSKTYNGWTNYATWRVALEIQNDSECFNHFQRIQRMYKNEAANQPYASHNYPELVRDLHLLFFDDFPSRLSANFWEILDT